MLFEQYSVANRKFNVENEDDLEFIDDLIVDFMMYTMFSSDFLGLMPEINYIVNEYCGILLNLEVQFYEKMIAGKLDREKQRRIKNKLEAIQSDLDNANRTILGCLEIENKEQNKETKN